MPDTPDTRFVLHETHEKAENGAPGSPVRQRFLPASRVTGINWALGVGRLGSVCGALVGGVLLAANIGFQLLFLLVAVPAAIASFAIFLCGAQARRVETQRALSAVTEGA